MRKPRIKLGCCLVAVELTDSVAVMQLASAFHLCHSDGLI
jgi:hypothetical protein